MWNGQRMLGNIHFLGDVYPLPLLKKTLLLMSVRAPPLQPHLTLIISLKALPLNIVTLWVQASMYELWKDTTLSRAGCHEH